eukprot:5726120-Pleurochrysis_carterae.AAC.1
MYAQAGLDAMSRSVLRQSALHAPELRPVLRVLKLRPSLRVRKVARALFDRWVRRAATHALTLARRLPAIRRRLGRRALIGAVASWRVQ